VGALVDPDRRTPNAPAGTVRSATLGFPDVDTYRDLAFTITAK
jgi:hypothetical protein